MFRPDIPGGFQEKGEDIHLTMARELLEETGVELDMKEAQIIHRGYVDDRRSTDNAWGESIAAHLHIGSSDPEIKAGDDAAAAGWIKLNMESAKKFYGNHPAMVAAVLQIL